MSDFSSYAPDTTCETSEQTFIGKRACGRKATHIYGPECEATTGQLMYLCESHAAMIETWMLAHPNDPVECPTHGRLGKVKDYIVLRRM